MTAIPQTIPDVQAAIRDSDRVRVRGAGTKTALAAEAAGALTLDLSTLSGVLEYEPSEFTFTALAGTPVAQVNDLLAQHGQYLPFDPLLAARGATLGGSLASGLSGPGRYRYGGLRDFILGVRWVNGAGDVVRGGGNVVKNAAGFDLPKLMVGSLGQYGALVELSFKVFPSPEATLTQRARYADLAAAVSALLRLYAAPLDIDSLDLVPDDDGGAALWVRLGGLRAVLPERAARVRGLLAADDTCDLNPTSGGQGGADDTLLWRSVREFEWVPPGWTVAKVPLIPARIAALEAALQSQQSVRRYSAAGNVAWLATPNSPADLLDRLGLAALLVLGPAASQPLLGPRPGADFARRVKQALDPGDKFGAFN